MKPPKIEIHNFEGFPRLSDERVRALAKRDLIVLVNRFIDDLEGVAKIKEINPKAKVLIYFNIKMIDFGDASCWTNYPEVEAFKDKGPWWLTHPGTTLADEMGPTDTKVKVGDSSIFAQGDPIVCGNELMLFIGAYENEVYMARGYLSTTPTSHEKGSRIAPVQRAVWGRNIGLSDTLYVNMTDKAPLVDGTRPNIFKADLFVEKYYNREEWRSVFDGVFWDCCNIESFGGRSVPILGVRQDLPARPFDIDNDNKPEDGREVFNLLLEGYEKFFKRLREKTHDDFIHVGNLLPPFGDIPKYANGFQREAFITGFGGRVPAIWESEMSWYRSWLQIGRKPRIVWNTCQPGVWNDFQTVRFGLCSTLLGDGYYQYRIHSADSNNFKYWYDEYWVDENGNPSEDERYRGWLGEAVSDAEQVIKQLNSPSLLSMSNWKLETLDQYANGSMTKPDAETISVKVGPLKIRYADTVVLSRWADYTFKPNAEYTLSFEAKASSPRLITFEISGEPGTNNIRSEAFIDAEWERHVISLLNRADKEQVDVTARFLLGLEEGEVQLRDIKLQTGLMEVGWMRKFENGLVLLNPTWQPQVFTNLGDGAYRKIKGRQDPKHNDSQMVVNKLTVPSRDGFVLMKNR